jgi:L-histidine N-alpha-methyltransferase
MLLDAGRRLIDDHAWLSVEALVGDYCAGLNDLPREQGGRLFVFLGGTIGNFYPREALSFLRELRGNMREDDWLLLGADRVKDLEVLNAAYNDAQGYTAEFNLNLLNVINRELSADFDLRAFSHRAYFNEDMSWIEMHLCSRRDQQVSIRDLDLQVSFARGETILTEISRKFTGQALAGTLRQAGFGLEQDFTPGNNYYSLVLARAAGS